MFLTMQVKRKQYQDDKYVSEEKWSIKLRCKKTSVSSVNRNRNYSIILRNTYFWMSEEWQLMLACSTTHTWHNFHNFHNFHGHPKGWVKSIFKLWNCIESVLYSRDGLFLCDAICSPRGRPNFSNLGMIDFFSKTTCLNLESWILHIIIIIFTNLGT